MVDLSSGKQNGILLALIAMEPNLHLTNEGKHTCTLYIYVRNHPSFNTCMHKKSVTKEQSYHNSEKLTFIPFVLYALMKVENFTLKIQAKYNDVV